MEEFVGGAQITQGAVESDGQPLAGDAAGNLDQSACCRERRKALNRAAVEAVEVAEPVHHMSHAIQRPAAFNHDVKRRMKQKVVEAVQRGGCLASNPARPIDAGEERAQFVEVFEKGALLTPEVDAARVSASKRRESVLAPELTT